MLPATPQKGMSNTEASKGADRGEKKDPAPGGSGVVGRKKKVKIDGKGLIVFCLFCIAFV